MAKASSGALSTFVTTDEGQQRVQAYKDAQDNLRQALEARENQLFDPTLLAISQALGSPTKTGSFGEVLGNVAGAIGTSQQAEDKRAREAASMRFELAQQGLQSYQATAKDKAFQDLVRAMTGQPPAGGEAPAGAPAGAPATAGAPAGAPPTAGAAPAAGAAPTGQVPGRINATPAQVLQLSDPRFGGAGEGVLKALTYQREGIIPTPQGPFDRDTGRFLDVPLPNEEQKSVVTPYGKFDLFPSQSREFLRQEQLGRGREYLESILKPKSKAPDGTLPPDASARELEQERKKQTLLADVKSDAERKTELINKSVLASNRLPILSTVEQFALTPDAVKLLGVFEGSTLGQAIAKMVEPSMPQIREAFTQYGLPEGVKADQGFVLQQIATINAEMRKILRAPGEGAQSDMENKMALAAGLDKSDTPGALVKKVRFLKAQAEFQRDLGRDFDKSKMTPTEFLLSDKYDGLLQTYEKKLGRILGLSPEQVKSSAPKPAGNYGPAKQKLLDDLGVKK
jgi:hypothetical protein